MKKILSYFLLIALGLGFIASEPARAVDVRIGGYQLNPGDGCGHLVVEVTNLTSTSCQLISSNVVHGITFLSPAVSLTPRQTNGFAYEETMFGPMVDTTYRCGGQRITIRSQQPYCTLLQVGAGSPKGTIIEKTAGIDAHATAATGSYYWGRPGKIAWQIQNTR